MNIIKKWLTERQRIKQQQKANDDAVDRACAEQRRVKIREKVAEFKLSCADTGIKFFGWSTSNEDYTHGTIRGMTPDSRIIAITISHQGGIIIEQLTHERSR